MRRAKKALHVSKEFQKDGHNVSLNKVFWMKRNLGRKRTVGFATRTGLENIERKKEWKNVIRS